MRRVRNAMVAVAMITLCFFGAGEILTRALDMVDRLNGYSRLLFADGPDADLPYRLRPGVETRWVGVPVRVNALGLRGPEVSAQPAAGVVRVLLLGDSVVFGQGVTEEEAVGARLEAALRESTPDTTWQVLNAGVQGYDTVAAARMLETAGMALGPAAVVVGMSLNDYDRAPAYHPLGVLARQAPGWTRWFEERSEFVLLLRWIVTWARGGLWQQMLSAADGGAHSPAPAAGTAIDAAVERAHRRFYAMPDDAAWARLGSGLGRLVRATAAARVPLLVAIFPESWQMAEASGVDEPQRRLLGLCGDVGATCLDLAPVFRTAGGALFLDAQHPNARGHAVAGAAIADALRAVLAPSVSAALGADDHV